jgi:hypothetical protein
MRIVTFEHVLRELHGLVGRTIVVGVQSARPDALVQLSGFAGRLLGADELASVFESDAVPDILS